MASFLGSRALAAFVMSVSLSLAAPTTAQPGWQTFVSPGFGTTITYPSYLFTSSTPNPDGILLTGERVSLEVSAIPLPEIQTVTDLRRFLASTPGYENVTYSPQGERWLVVSGYRGPNVFYEKFFVGGGVVEAFSFEYPMAERQLYDGLVETLEDSFRRGV